MTVLPMPDRPRPPVREEGPNALVNSDGSPNLASRAFQAIAASCELAHELLIANDIEPTAGRVKLLGRHLLYAADQVQTSIRDTALPDRCSYSHTRARGAVRTVAHRHPLPKGQGVDAIEQWAQLVQEEAATVLQVAVDLYVESL
jgi:hypothetical protein